MVFPFENIRASERFDVLFASEILYCDKTIPCEIRDISVGGLRVTANWTAPRAEAVVVKIDKAGDFQARVVWVRDGEVGLEFDDDPDRLAELVTTMATYGGR